MTSDEMDEIIGEHMDPWNLWATADRVLLKIYNSMRLKMEYRNVKTHKFPMDSWVYQQIITALRPDVIVELGNQYGGSTLYLRDLMNLYTKHGVVIGVDQDHGQLHPLAKEAEGIQWVEGDSENRETVEKVWELAGPPKGPRMVIDDAAHTVENTYQNLVNYSGLVTVGSFYVVEDTIDNYCIKHENKTINPFGGVKKFMDQNKDFEIERMMEMYFLTFNPKGYLRRKR